MNPDSALDGTGTQLAARPDDHEPGRVLLWVRHDTWQACVESARRVVCDRDEVTILYVLSNGTESDSSATRWYRTAEGHSDALWRSLHDESARGVLDRASEALGRRCETKIGYGRVERVVVAEVVTRGIHLLCLGRDNVGGRPARRNLDRSERFVVDHAPCSVLVCDLKTEELQVTTPRGAQPKGSISPELDSRQQRGTARRHFRDRGVGRPAVPGSFQRGADTGTR